MVSLDDVWLGGRDGGCVGWCWCCCQCSDAGCVLGSLIVRGAEGGTVAAVADEEGDKDGVCV